MDIPALIGDYVSAIAVKKIHLHKSKLRKGFVY